MSPFEYILPLVSVLVGLAIADLTVSFNRLLRARARVRWDWLTLTTALLAVLAVLDIWWVLYGTQESRFYLTLAGFLPLVVQLILLFLINAAALPDDVPEEGIDLREFYQGNSAYLWSLFAIYFFNVLVQRSIFFLMADSDFFVMFKGVFFNLVTVALLISLVFVKNRLFHAVVVVALLIYYSAQWFGKTLAAG